MFSALRQGSQVYILEKGNPASLKIGQVVSATSPNQIYQYLPNSTVDIVVKIDEQTSEFKQLPGSLSIANYNNGNTIISESRDLMAQEVENLIKSSRQALESVPIHKANIEAGEKMLKELSPSYAKQKDQEEKIVSLESKVGGIESKIDSIYSMLQKTFKNE